MFRMMKRVEFLKACVIIPKVQLMNAGIVSVSDLIESYFLTPVQ